MFSEYIDFQILNFLEGPKDYLEPHTRGSHPLHQNILEVFMLCSLFFDVLGLFYARSVLVDEK